MHCGFKEAAKTLERQLAALAGHKWLERRVNAGVFTSVVAPAMANAYITGVSNSPQVPALTSMGSVSIDVETTNADTKSALAFLETGVAKNYSTDAV